MMTGLGLPGAQRTLAQRIARDAGPPPAGPEEANLRRVDPGFFQTLAMPILEGRSFSDADRKDAPPVAIVNRTMARTYWGSTPVVGQRLSFERIDGSPVWLDIVGVVADTRDIALTSLPQPAFFVPLAQHSNALEADSASLYLRTTGDPVVATNAVRSAIWQVDPAQPVADVSTMDEAIDRFVEAPRFRTGLLTALAGVGLFLSVIGIYGVVSHAVTERVPEMAVRLALGAERRQIISLVLKHGVSLASAGVLIGVSASVLGAHWLQAILFGIAPVDPLTLLVAPVLVLGVASAACYLPARRAAATDAVRAMRGDAT
jgi:predicted permease